VRFACVAVDIIQYFKNSRNPSVVQ